MTSATDRLRALLDERGVEWEAWNDCITVALPTTHFLEISTGTLTVAMVDLTPEQAIDATLGRGTCEVIGFDDGYDEGLDGEWFALAPATWFLSCDHEAHGRRPSYCPVCGRKVKEG